MEDCPICYEIINAQNNCATTECGHSFHTSCLLKHTAFNGYGCPCCRTQLSDKPPSPSLLSEDIYREEENDEYEIYREEAVQYDQYVLDGCRWMFQRANCEDINDTDPYTDAFERWKIQMTENCKEYENEMERKTDLIFKELTKINAFSYEDLVRGYLFWNQDTPQFCNSVNFEFYNRKITNTLKSVVGKLDF